MKHIKKFEGSNENLQYRICNYYKAFREPNMWSVIRIENSQRKILAEIPIPDDHGVYLTEEQKELVKDELVKLGYDRECKISRVN